MLCKALQILALAMLIAAPALAQSPAEPAGEVVLTVTGTRSGAAAPFDLAGLEALGAVEFETSTIWTEGPQRFTGVPLHILAGHLRVAGGTLRATAVNNYSVDIPLSDAVEGGPIIAYRRNGKEMPLRDKGPLWIVYPYDSKSEYQSEVVYSRSIWQLDRIELIE